MNKLIPLLIVAAMAATASSPVFACAKGQHLVGGTGSHHKGGQCVASSTAKPKAMTPAKK